MAEVAEHLIPQDGLSNARIIMEGLDAGTGGSAHVRFGLYDENELLIGVISIEVEATVHGTLDALVAEAHRHMCDVLRQWLYRTDVMRQAYEKRSV